MIIWNDWNPEGFERFIIEDGYFQVWLFRNVSKKLQDY